MHATWAIPLTSLWQVLVFAVLWMQHKRMLSSIVMCAAAAALLASIRLRHGMSVARLAAKRLLKVLDYIFNRLTISMMLARDAFRRMHVSTPGTFETCSHCWCCGDTSRPFAFLQD